tara:strand:- start:282 stop:623 length:342 start_codon:yes stop_codon:yes gene_type:complete
MKTYYFILFLLAINFTTYASFPVKRTIDVITTENISSNDMEYSNTSTFVTAVAGDSQIVALLLCWFLGILGIHRFYLGDTWQGIVQLLTFGGLGIWVLIDFILICVGELGPGW